jgi:hypothetical protein
LKTKIITIAALAFVVLAVIMIVPVNACTNWNNYYSYQNYNNYSNCDPKLPTTTVQMTAVANDPTSYFLCNFSGIPSGYDINNTATYMAWCGDQSTHMDRGVSHNFALYSTLDPPSQLDSINWNAVNYILNHKNGTLVDIQFAIWYFTNNYPSIGLSPYIDSMITAALANPNYTPGNGKIIGIIAVPINEPNAQMSIIEITVICHSTYCGSHSWDNNGCFWYKNGWYSNYKYSWSSWSCNNWNTGYNWYSSGCFGRR